MSYNDITGDTLRTKTGNNIAYSDGFDKAFRSKATLTTEPCKDRGDVEEEVLVKGEDYLCVPTD